MPTTFDLSTLGLPAGTHSITVKARAKKYEDSDESNAVSYVIEEIIEGSEGLAYTLSDDGTYYICSGIGTCRDTDIVIANEYEGKPVKEIGTSAFNSSTSLTSVVIPDSVTSIGSYAFYSSTSLTSIVIGEGVQTIGSNAFQRCYNLIEVINRSELNITVGSDSHGYVANYAAKVHTGETAGEFVTVGDFVFYIHDGVNYLARYKGSEKNLTLPESYNGQGYVIANWSFHDNNSITRVVIPAGVQTIDESAFSWCSSLTSVVIGNGVTSIGSYAFLMCDNLTSVEIGNSVTYIGDSAFSSCDSLTSVVIPDSVTSIGEHTFSSCDSLTSVVIGNGVTSIGTSAFNRCTSLTSVVIPDSVTSIGSYAFHDCDNLTSVEIGESVQTIGSYAFNRCTSLTSVVIGNGVTSIGNYAFYNCTSLAEIRYNGTIAQWNSISKVVDWDSNIPATYVQCTDGTVTI